MKNSPSPLPIVLLACASLPALAAAADVTAPPATVSWGAFVDAYYAYDFNRPKSFDRAFTTQPARHNEFNLNLAYLEAKVESEKMHGRLALQAGTSVQSNYAGEPVNGSISGPSLSRNIQEAFIGTRIATDTWIDAGVMLSHIGLESFISRDNTTYTRSLVADYSPYYQTGVRLSSKLSEKLSVQALVLNGWQNISESNSEKAFGTQVNYSLSPEFSMTYNTFFGKESASFRHFHDLVLKYSPSESWSLAAQADLGFQNEAAGGKDARWNGFTLITKKGVSQTVSLIARIERYADPKQVLITAVNGSAFRAWSASLGVDTELEARGANKTFWRNEIRGFHSENEIFANRAGFQKSDTVIVSSISSSF